MKLAFEKHRFGPLLVLGKRTELDPISEFRDASARPLGSSGPSKKKNLTARETLIRSLIEHPPKPNKHLKEAVKIYNSLVRA